MLTHRECYCVHPFSLECFVKYAFEMGQGMELEEAISERHTKVQECLSDLSLDLYGIPEEIMPDQGHICLN
jgi:hypothetical protein